MTEAEFRAYQKVFADYVEQKKALGILVNMSRFHHKPEPDFGEWRVKNISNRYSGAALKREAFVFPENASIPPERNRSFKGEQFPTRAFNDREQAIAWLTTGKNQKIVHNQE